MVGNATSAVIWAHFTENDHTAYDETTSGDETHAGRGGAWGQTSHFWAVPANKTGLVIEAQAGAMKYFILYTS